MVETQAAVTEAIDTAGAIATVALTSSAAISIVLGSGLSAIVGKLVLLQLILVPSAFKILHPINVVDVSKTIL